MLPFSSKASSGAAKLEKRRHVLRIDELEALNLKGVWNVGQIELKSLLLCVEIRAQDRVVDVTLDHRIECASRDGKGLRFGHQERRIKVVVNDDVKPPRRTVGEGKTACRGELDGYGEHFQGGAPIHVHLFKMMAIGLCVNEDWIKQPGNTRRSEQDLPKQLERARLPAVGDCSHIEENRYRSLISLSAENRELITTFRGKEARLVSSSLSKAGRFTY